jgi:radical SAM-linked protein
MRYAIKFKKTGLAAYVGHLDTQRLWTRLLRMAGVDIAYSQGFNPHPKISLASPLSLGFESKGEYLEFVSTKKLDSEALAAKLKQSLPVGFELTSIFAREESYPKSLAYYSHFSTYSIHTDNFLGLEEKLADFLLKRPIILTKTSKKTGKLRDIDLCPQILELSTASVYNKKVLFFAKLLAENNNTLNPTALLDLFYSTCNESFEISQSRIVRLDIFGKDGKSLLEY